MKTLFLLLLFIINLSFSSFSQTSQIRKDPNYFSVKSWSEKYFQNQINCREETNNWLNRWLWTNRMDFDNEGNFKYLQFANTVSFKNQEKDRPNNILSLYSWLPLGPVVKPPSYETRSCYSMGRVNCVASHPTKANIVWIGTPGGGIWKTENSGKNWIPLGDKFSTMAISHIAVDPKNPDIIYAATGDYDGSGMTSANAQGVFKSTDGGITWSATTLITDPNFNYSLLKKIIINPQNTDQLLAGGRRGIWKSLDAGKTWLRVCDSIITDMDFSPPNPNAIFAAMGQLWGTGSAGVLKSTDFGSTWTVLNTGMPAQGQISRVALSVSPADPNYIYVIGVKSNTNSFHSFYQSTNAGATWTTKATLDSANNILGVWGGDLNDTYGQGSYDLVLLADPINKDKVYTAGTNMWMTENAGKDWDIVSFWIYCFGESIHADHHCAAYNPLDQSFYWGNDGGIYRTKSIGAGSKKWIVDWIDHNEENAKPGHPDFKFPTVWENLSDGLAITEFYRMSLSKNNKNVLAAGAQDNSCYYYNNGNWLNYIPNYDGMETMIDNDNPDIFYGVWQNGGLCKTSDGGKTLLSKLSYSIQEKGNWITPTVMDPINSNVIYMGFRNLWRSRDGGLKWEIAFNFDSIPVKQLNTNSLSIVKMSPANSKYISIAKDAGWYQDTAKNWKQCPSEMWTSEDAGMTWRRCRQGLPIDSMNLISIDYDYLNPKKIWLAFYSYNSNVNTYMTTDAGVTWKDYSKPLPASIMINTLAHQPYSPSNIRYVGTNKGVYYTDDTKKDWSLYSDNLPNCIVYDLKIQYSTKELFAATYGRGIWKTNLSTDAVYETINNDQQISVYPNPSSGAFTININSTELMSSDKFNLKIIDVTGNSVYDELIAIDESMFSKQIKTDLINGVYFMQILLNNRYYSTKLMIMKE
ncbi:MAG: T9SS type A sorting domain-containing protein [Candidatus Kapabacteria bacterium]|nr:T9SS type A sorting domain-containing protein [Candidatus Kapabacteria bacterium]